jgi:hypothetical protein
VRNAANRMQWLGVRPEGDFAPLARLHRFKRDAALAADPEAIVALARDTEAFPPGIVRAESSTATTRSSEDGIVPCEIRAFTSSRVRCLAAGDRRIRPAHGTDANSASSICWIASKSIAMW